MTTQIITLKNHKTAEALYEGAFSTVVSCVEQAISERVTMDEVDLSYQNLSYANFDNGSFKRAKFTGANLHEANLSECDFTGADLSHTDLTMACLAISRLYACDMRGASLGLTDVTDAEIMGCRFSCPTIFDTAFHRCHIFQDCLYYDDTGAVLPLATPPIVIKGLPKSMTILDHHIQIGHEIFEKSDHARLCTLPEYALIQPFLTMPQGDRAVMR